MLLLTGRKNLNCYGKYLLFSVKQAKQLTTIQYIRANIMVKFCERGKVLFLQYKNTNQLVSGQCKWGFSNKYTNEYMNHCD